MTVVITTFGGVALPGHDWSAELGTPRTINPIVKTLTGPFDIVGVRRRIQHDDIFDIQGTLDSSTLAATVRALKGQVGRTGYVVRTDADGTNSLQRYCRCLHVGQPVLSRQRGSINVIPVTFFTNEPFWRSSTTTTRTFSGLTAGANACVFTNAGEEDILDAVITFTATANTTSLTLNHSKSENSATIVSNLVFSSTILNTKILSLNCTVYTVTNDGVSAYSGLTEGSTHTETYWFRFPPGSNTITATLGGTGTGTLNVIYNNQYQ